MDTSTASPESPRSRVPLGIVILVTAVTAFALLGSVRAPARVVVHLMVAVAALAGRALPDASLRRAGVTLRWLTSASVLVLVSLLACLPVPAGLARILAPGRLAALPDASFVTLGVDAEGVLGAAFTLALALGFGAVVTTWGSTRYRTTHVEGGATALTGLLAASGLLHAVGGATTAFNVLAPVKAPTPFFAPLVNPAHMAAGMLLGAPIAFARVLDRSASTLQRWAAAIALGLAALVIGWVRSEGAILVGSLAAGAVVALRLRARRASSSEGGAQGRPWPPGLLLALGSSVVLVLWAAWNAWTSGSVTVRWALWTDALRLGADHWLVGSGWGDFGEAIRAYRTDHDHVAFAHAHNELLEWAVGTGLVGVVALPVAVAWTWTSPVRRRRRGGGLLIGAAALVVYSLVDFPLQVPAVAMALAGVLACFVAVYGAIRAAEPLQVRRALLALAVVQALGAAWSLREVVVLEAATRLDGGDASAAPRLRVLLAMPEQVALHEAMTSPQPSLAVEAVAAAYPDDADLQRRAGAQLARRGALDAATRAFARAAERDPSDHRAFVALARLAGARGDLSGAAEHWADALRRNSGRLVEAWRTFPVGLYWVDALADAPAHQMWSLASLLHKEGADEEALLAIDATAERDPAAYGDHVFRVQVLLALGRPEAALAWIEDLAARQGASPEVLAARGEVLTAMGRHADAADTFRRAGRTKPELRARAVRSMEAASGAERALAFAAELELDGVQDPAVALEVARLKLAVGDPAGCVAEIERRGLVVSRLRKPAGDLLRACRKAAP